MHSLVSLDLVEARPAGQMAQSTASLELVSNGNRQKQKYETSNTIKGNHRIQQNEGIKSQTIHVIVAYIRAIYIGYMCATIPYMDGRDLTTKGWPGMTHHCPVIRHCARHQRGR